jgi:hypothetical protein
LVDWPVEHIRLALDIRAVQKGIEVSTGHYAAVRKMAEKSANAISTFMDRPSPSKADEIKAKIALQGIAMCAKFEEAMANRDRIVLTMQRSGPGEGDSVSVSAVPSLMELTDRLALMESEQVQIRSLVHPYVENKQRAILAAENRAIYSDDVKERAH